MKINPYLQTGQKTNNDYSAPKTDKAKSSWSAGFERQLKDLGVSSSAEMQSAYKIYKNANIEPNKTNMAETQKFLEKADGSSANKLLTVQVAAAKGMDITEKNLTAVHAALNDTENATMTLENLLKDEFQAAESSGVDQAAIDEAVADIPDAVKKEVYAALKEMGLSDKEAVEIGNRLLSGESAGSIMADQSRKGIEEMTANFVKKLKENEKKGPQNLMEAMLFVEGKLKITLLKVKMNVETTQTTLVEGANKLSFDADQLKAVLNQLLDRVDGLNFEDGSIPETDQSDLGVTVPVTADASSETVVENTGDIDAFEGRDDFLTQLDSLVDNALAEMMSAYGQADLQSMFESKETKTYLVTEVTVRMVTVKSEFDRFKKESLTVITQSIETANPKDLADVAVKVADKLDKLIMQSDLTLYTDMKTERKLVGLSSDLQKVAELAPKDPQAALQWLKDVKRKMDKLLFEPSKQKVQVFLRDDSARLAGIATNELQQQSAKMTQGAKPVLDFMRAMGLNHEAELMDTVFASDFSDKSDKTQTNLKQMLLQLAADDHEDQQLVKAVEKGLNQLTGQQLLNKPEPQSDTQSLFFNIPLQTGEDSSQMRLYVKARKTVEKMDWENCSMYLLVDLKQFGETGIRIQSSQRQLSISISNTSEDIMTVVKPFALDILDELKEIGYNPGEIKYVPFTKVQDAPAELPKVVPAAVFETETNQTAAIDRKGFELKI